MAAASWAREEVVGRKACRAEAGPRTREALKPR